GVFRTVFAVFLVVIGLTVVRALGENHVGRLLNAVTDEFDLNRLTYRKIGNRLDELARRFNRLAVNFGDNVAALQPCLCRRTILVGKIADKGTVCAFEIKVTGNGRGNLRREDTQIGTGDSAVFHQLTVYLRGKVGRDGEANAGARTRIREDHGIDAD